MRNIDDSYSMHNMDADTICILDVLHQYHHCAAL